MQEIATILAISCDIQHFHRRLAAHIRFFGVFEQLMPCIFICPADLEQYERLRFPPPGWGALSLLPVARLYLALPLAVRPAPLDAGLFSPRLTERETAFFRVFFFAIRMGPVCCR